VREIEREMKQTKKEDGGEREIERRNIYFILSADKGFENVEFWLF
jgi:hypothetical protein